MGTCKSTCADPFPTKNAIQNIQDRLADLPPEALKCQQAKREMLYKAQKGTRLSFYQGKKIPSKLSCVSDLSHSFDFTQSLFGFPQKIKFLIFSYMIDEIENIQKVSTFWYFRINEIMQQELLHIDNAFIKHYGECLQFSHSFLSTKTISFNQKTSLRRDHNIVAEILDCPPCTITLRAQFQIFHAKKKIPYQYHYSFQINKHRQVTLIHDQATLPNQPYLLDPVVHCINDILTFNFTFFSLLGYVDLSTVDFYPIEISPLLPLATPFDYYENWESTHYFPFPEEIPKFPKLKGLTLVKLSCYSVGVFCFRAEFIADKKGLWSLQGVLGEVKDGPCEGFIGRQGRLPEIHGRVQLQKGDTIVLYIQKKMDIEEMF